MSRVLLEGLVEHVERLAPLTLFELDHTELVERLHHFVGRQVVAVLHQQHLIELARLLPVLEREVRLGQALNGGQVRLIERVGLAIRLHRERVVTELAGRLTEQEREPLVLIRPSASRSASPAAAGAEGPPRSGSP